MSRVPDERCSVAAQRAGDPLVGTAPPARRWLLVEHAGPWGRAGYAGSDLDPAVVRALSRWAEGTGGRVVLVRRPGRAGRQRRDDRHWFVADSRYGHVGTTGGTFADERELIGIAENTLAENGIAENSLAGNSLAGNSLAENGLPEGTPAPGAADPLILVCTHGRHDTCCAISGRPTAAALAQRYPECVWECSHIGGCRFTPAVVLLPHGFVLGSVPEPAVTEVVARYLGGEVGTRWLRGRSSLSPVEQAAQLAARSRLDAPALDALRPVAVAGDSSEWRVTLAAPDCVVHLAERRVELDRPLTCTMTRPGWQRAFDTIAVLPA